MNRYGRPIARDVVFAAMVSARRPLGTKEVAALVGKSTEATLQLLYGLQEVGVVESEKPAGKRNRAFLALPRQWKLTGKPLPKPVPNASPANDRSPSGFDHRALARALGMDVMPTEPRPARSHTLGVH